MIRNLTQTFTMSNSSNQLTYVDDNQELSIALIRTGDLEQGIYKHIKHDNKQDNTGLSSGKKKPYLPKLPDRSTFRVDFDGPKDPCHPYFYPLWRKILYSFSAALTTFSITFGSTIFAQGSENLMEICNVSYTVASLTTSLFVLGFASGPIIFCPISELFGRKIVLIISCFGYVCFTFAVASGKDLQTIMLCRFFAGFVGGGPLAVAPGVLTDLFQPKDRPRTITIFPMVFFSGSMLGPVVGGFVTRSKHLGWRWNSYVSGMIGSLALLCTCFVLKETHHPTLLTKKAQLLRKQTGIWGFHATQEDITIDWKAIARENVAKPMIFLITEPIILLLSIYNAFIYGMVYAFLSIIPMVFLGIYGWKAGVFQLPYLSMLLGVFVGGAIIVYFELLYNHKLETTKGSPIPETKLPPIMIGGSTFVIGIFLFGWTGNYPNKTHWILPVIGTFFIGNGIILVYLPSITYIIACYPSVAASASASNMYLRTTFAASFPLFSRQMFGNLTIRWASTMLGCVGILLLPVPSLFYKFGARARGRSKYAKK